MLRQYERHFFNWTPELTLKSLWTIGDSKQNLQVEPLQLTEGGQKRKQLVVQVLHFAAVFGHAGFSSGVSWMFISHLCFYSWRGAFASGKWMSLRGQSLQPGMKEPLETQFIHQITIYWFDFCYNVSKFWRKLIAQCDERVYGMERRKKSKLSFCSIMFEKQDKVKWLST